MAAAPRPAARVLLAGRFIVSRTALLALPDGPVPGLDLSSGAPVSLELRPAADHDGLVRRCERWNALGLAGPAVRDVRTHLTRSVVACDPAVGARGEATSGSRATSLSQAAGLGAALDRAGLGIAPGPPALALSCEGPVLGRPAIWPADPARPLEQAFEQVVGGICAAPVAASPRARPARRVRRPALRSLGRELRSRRVRVTGALAVAAACALVGSSVLAGSGETVSSWRARARHARTCSLPGRSGSSRRSSLPCGCRRTPAAVVHGCSSRPSRRALPSSAARLWPPRTTCGRRARGGSTAWSSAPDEAS